MAKLEEVNPSEPALPLSSFDEDSSFTPVSRKERKTDKKQKVAPQQQAAAAPVSSKRELPLPKESEKSKESQREAKKVFVEAPLPKVNPWQVNRNIPHIVPAAEAQSEKRVLKPQKQEAIVNGQASPAIVQAPKDRRKYNQKVIALLHSFINFKFPITFITVLQATYFTHAPCGLKGRFRGMLSGNKRTLFLCVFINFKLFILMANKLVQFFVLLVARL